MEHLKFRLAQVWVPYLSARPPSFQPGLLLPLSVLQTVEEGSRV